MSAVTPAVRRKVGKAFGAALRRTRRQKGLSQEEVAYRADINRTYMSMLERGKRTPTLTIIFLLADVLEVSPGQLTMVAKAIMKD
jgi:transcriptional regulator with XRE-family HTH domain